MKSILFFEEIGKDHISEVGGKGANLGEMTRAGFPVPGGFCLTTEVYDDYVREFDFQGKSPEQIREELRLLTIKREHIGDLKEALKRFPDEALFSVRSSATAEDLPFASFAGQQDTYLNVSKEDIEDAVKKCFASLFTDRAVAYRQKNGIDHVSMAVVVQKMVRSDRSGVMFTADPVTCRRNLLVIDAVYGLGEAIVSGIVSPDHYEYERETGEIRIAAVPEKEYAILPTAGGGTEKRTINSQDQVLQEKEIRELAQLGEEVEAHYGRPQDLEWGIEGGRLYLLQTRAITSLYPVPVFRDDRYHFAFNLGYQQMYPKAMPLLSVDILKNVVNLGERDDSLTYYNGLVVEGTNYLLVDLSRILSVPPVRKVMLGKLLVVIDPGVIPAFRQLLARGRRLGRPPRLMVGVFRRMIRRLIPHIRSTDPQKEAKDLVEEIERRRKENTVAIESAKLSHEGLLTILDHIGIFDFFTGKFMPALIGGGFVTLLRLKKTEKAIGAEGAFLDDIQAGNEGNIGTEMNLRMGDLADLVNADDVLRNKLESGFFDLSCLKTDHPGFMAEFEDFQKDFGFRTSGELDISKPRWQDDPEKLISLILGMAEGKTEGSHKVDFEEKKNLAEKQMKAFAAAIEEKQGKRKADKAYRDMIRFRTYWALREHLKYFWMTNFGAARQAILSFADDFVARGLMDEREDIFHLYLTEIDHAIDHDDDLRERISERKNEYERLFRLPPPRIITSEGEVLQGGVKGEGIPENALAGFGVSAGRIEGIAHVVHDPRGASLEKGEILVAAFTDPGWTPLFVNAAGLVTEVGGMLTHGAVVAREYGIPGVVGVTDATSRIHTGQKIIVDGSNGFVELF